mgnify:CR=1 FL=1
MRASPSLQFHFAQLGIRNIVILEGPQPRHMGLPNVDLLMRLGLPLLQQQKLQRKLKKHIVLTNSTQY